MTVLAAREDKSPAVQALLDCLASHDFHLQVYICSVGQTAGCTASQSDDHQQWPNAWSIPSLTWILCQLPPIVLCYARHRRCWQHGTQQLPHSSWPTLQPADRPGRHQACEQV